MPAGEVVDERAALVAGLDVLDGSGNGRVGEQVVVVKEALRPERPQRGEQPCVAQTQRAEVVLEVPAELIDAQPRSAGLEAGEALRVQLDELLQDAQVARRGREERRVEVEDDDRQAVALKCELDALEDLAEVRGTYARRDYRPRGAASRTRRAEA